MVLLKANNFLSRGFNFLTMSTSLNKQSRQFVALSSLSCFSSNFCFLFFFSVYSYAAIVIIGFGKCFFLCSFSCISRFFLLIRLCSFRYWRVFFLLFLCTYTLSMSSVGNKSLCIVITFLVLWSISSLSSLRMVQSILPWVQLGRLFLWWDSCRGALFRKVFSFF